MDSYMLILYVTLNQEEAIRKLFYEEGWKYIKEDGDLTIVRSDELHGTISAGVNDDNSADVSTFHFDVSCPEENESGILKSTIGTFGDQNRNCSFENRDNDIAYNFETNCQNNNIENGTQHKKSFTEIKGNRIVNGNDCHYDNVQADFVDNGKQTRCNENDLKEYCVKDIQGQNFEQGSAEDGLTTNKQDSDGDYLSDNRQDDDDVSKLKTKTGHDSHSIGTDESSVDKLKHLISRGKLLSIENRKRLKQERKALRPAKKRKKLDTYKCKISSKKKPIFCSDCKVTFTSQNRFDKHKERNGGQCVFPCQYCDKVFLYRKSRYDLHVRSAHSKERPFKCDVCQKGYITSDKLKIHKRVHTGEKPCVCEECGKAFYSRGDLSSHREYHHISKERQDNLTCDLCNLTFCNQRYLTYHKNVTHSTRRDFHCQTCSKSFKSNSSLKRHLKYIHSEVKNFRCDACDKSFKTAGSLKKHKVRHGGERTFFCTECNKGFYEKAKLDQHIRTHTGEKPYSCHLCEYKCALSGNLSKHMKTHYRELTNAVL